MNCNTRFSHKFIGLICLLGFFMADLTEAATVSQVRGKNVLIELQGTAAKPGDIFFVVNPQGQRQGVVRIGQVRGRQATAQLGRGQAQPGWSLVPRSQQAGRPGSPSATPPSSSARQATQGKKGQAAQTPKTSSASPMLFGLLVGYSMSSMSLKPQDSAEYSLSGGSISAKGILDYAILGSIGLRASLGLQQLNVDGKNATDQESSLSVNYLSAGFWGRYSFTQTNFRPWAGGGINLLFPMSAETKNSIRKESVQTTSLFSAGGGLDFYFSPRLMIPIQFEYNLFPPTDSVNANMITVRLGVSYGF